MKINLFNSSDIFIPGMGAVGFRFMKKSYSEKVDGQGASDRHADRPPCDRRPAVLWTPYGVPEAAWGSRLPGQLASAEKLTHGLFGGAPSLCSFFPRESRQQSSSLETL